MPPTPHPSSGQRGFSGYANGAQTHRSTGRYPDIRRKPLEERTADRLEAAKQLHLRLAGEPSPRYLGVDVGVMEIVHDRGTFTAVDTAHQDLSHAASDGWRLIAGLPRDHVQWEDTCAREDWLRGGPQHRAAMARGIREDASWSRSASTGSATSGLSSRRRGDHALHHELAPIPVHHCSGHSLFPLHYTPRRGRCPGDMSCLPELSRNGDVHRSPSVPVAGTVGGDIPAFPRVPQHHLAAAHKERPKRESSAGSAVNRCVTFFDGSDV